MKFSKVVVPFYNTTKNMWMFTSHYTLSNVEIIYLLIFCSLIRYVMVTDHDSNLGVAWWPMILSISPCTIAHFISFYEMGFSNFFFTKWHCFKKNNNDLPECFIYTGYMSFDRYLWCYIVHQIVPFHFLSGARRF